MTVRERAKVLGRTRSKIAGTAESLTVLCANDQRTNPVETVSAELIPLCDAIRFIARQSSKILRPRKLGFWGRPSWLLGTHSKIERLPHGTVLILCPWNYPLFLVGAQLAGALVGGNRVLVKPAPGCEILTAELVNCFYESGVPRELIEVLDSSTESATRAIDKGVDLVVLTGSANTGRKVMSKLAETLTPSIMELSGCDAAIVLPQADLDLTASAIDFGLTINSGATCIGPRRLIVESSPQTATLIERLDHRFKKRNEIYVVHPSARETVSRLISCAINRGAKVVTGRFDSKRFESTGEMEPLILDNVTEEFDIASADVFAPVISILRVPTIEHAIELVNDCRYRLAASVFGPNRQAIEIASQLSVGTVTINDIIAPTADPRVPFGGRGSSGFGVTRGEEGLLAMTVPRVTTRRRGRFAFHLRFRDRVSVDRMIQFLKWTHLRT